MLFEKNHYLSKKLLGILVIYEYRPLTAFFVFHFLQLVANVFMLILLMTGFEPQASDSGNDQSANWVTTTAPTKIGSYTGNLSFPPWT